VILDQYAPPACLVNEKYEIVRFIGNTDRYLKTPVGKATFHILDMVREGLKYKLSTALHNATRQKKEVSNKSLRVIFNGDARIVDLTVRPLIETRQKGAFFLVLFKDQTPAKMPGQKKGKKGKAFEGDPVVVSLEQELAATKEHLQSTNEELETSEEELQSTNEELITVNTELQNKVDELSSANNDINNLLAATDIGTIFLDTRLHIKRYTPAMTRIFNLIPSDVDRPISDITAKIDYADMMSDAETVLRTLVPKEAELKTKEGGWYSMKIMLYRTVENVIDGLVIIFVDNTEVKRRGSTERLTTVLRDSNDAVLLLDFDGWIFAWNRGAERMYGYSEEEALNMNIRDLIPKDKAGEAAAAVKRLQSGELVASFQTQRITKERKILDVWLTMTALSDESGKPAAIATTERDATKGN